MSMLESLGAAQQNQGRATHGRTPIYRIEVSGVPLEVNVQSVSMSLGEDMHDTVVMTVSSSERTTTSGLLEQTISFLYGNSTKTEVFSGYITEVAEQQNETGVLTWTMQIVGPTKPMQVGQPRFWSKRSIPSAVELVAYYSYLGYVGHAHNYLWPSLAQTDNSDWKVAVNMARRLGWSVFNRYGVVMLYDPLQLFMNSGSVATLISETYSLAKNSFDDERTLLEFEPQEEAENSTDQRGYKVAYFSGGTVQVAEQKGEHSNYQFLNNFVIRNPEEAGYYVNSKESDSSSWRQTAKARIMGNALLFPGMTVDVLTTNQNYYTGKFNGRWFIRGVQHKMDKQTFQSNLVLSRPDGKVNVYSGAYRPFWQEAAKARPVLTYLAETRGWISSWTNTNAASAA